MILESLERLAEIETPANPFPGLRPFEFHQSHLFFGREGQTRQLIEKLTRTRFLAVVGTSGGGKSSLVRAGLLPDLLGGLMKGAGSNWRVALLRPGNDPIGNLARELYSTDAFGPSDDMRIATTEATLRRGNLGLIEVARQAGMSTAENLIVIADQFEELFRLKYAAQAQDPREERANDNAAFVKLLLEAAKQRGLRIYVTLTMRSDYLGECARFQDLPEAINDSQYLIPRLTREQRRLAITGPIAVGGAEIAPRLVTQLLNDAGDSPDQLPILQHVLMRTWEKWEGHRTGPLDLDDYQKAGTTERALSIHAEEAFGDLTPPQRKLAETLFKRITEKVADQRESRRLAKVEEIRAVAQANESEVLDVIEVFRAPGRSFLTTPTDGELSAASLIDISHESLIRGWPRLQGWVDEEAQSARLYKRLAETAVLHAKPEPEAEIWRGADLREALAWYRRQTPNPVWARRYHSDFELAQQFLAESRHAVWRRYGFAAAVLLLGLVVLFYAWGQRQAAAEQARANRRLYYNTSINFAKDAFARANTTLGRARLAEFLNDSDGLRGFEWHHFWLRYPGEVATLSGQGVPLLSLAFAPDGERLALGDQSGALKLWAMGSANVPLSRQAHEGEVTAVAYAPDGSALVTGGADGKLQWWRPGDAQPVRAQMHGAYVRALAFSPDGKQLVSAGDNGTLKLWDASSGQVLAVSFKAGGKALTAVAFAPDGTRLASAGEDGWVRLWETHSGRELAQLEGKESWLSLTFAPDGKQLVAGGDKGKVWVLEVNGGLKERQAVQGNPPVSAVAFAPGGTMLAAGCGAGLVRLWETGGFRELALLKAHTDRVTALAFAPRGETLASASLDGMVKLWDTSAGPGVLTLKPHTLPVRVVAYFPDGKRLASASEDGTVKLWDIDSAKAIRSLSIAGGTAWALAVAPDGKQLASGGADGTVRIWETESGRELQALNAHAGKVNAIAFAPDGKRLVSAGADGKVILSDAQSGHSLATLKELGTAALSVAFAPDGTRLAGGLLDGSIVLWEANSGRALLTLKGHTEQVNAVVFARSGKQLASAGNDWAIKLWDATNGRELLTFSGQGTPVLAAALSPDGKRLASSGEDGRVKLWETTTAQEIVTLPGLYPTQSLVFSPNGMSLASGGGKGQEGSVVVWFAAAPKSRGQ